MAKFQQVSACFAKIQAKGEGEEAASLKPELIYILNLTEVFHFTFLLLVGNG